MSDLEKAKSILRALIEADARGQGLPWQEAMRDAYEFLKSQEPIVWHFFMREDSGKVSCISCGAKYSDDIYHQLCPGKGKLAEYERDDEVAQENKPRRVKREPSLFAPYGAKDDDPVNHPKHYTSHPSGVECIDITRHLSFNIGNAIKYLWRIGQKEGEDAVTALEKARFYIEDQIKLIRKEYKTYK